MKARDIMTPRPACCTADTALHEVARQMVEHDCGAIPIVEEMGKQVVGIITDRDMVTRGIAERRNPLDMRAKDIMSPNVATVHQDTSLDEICQTMEQRQVRRIPVLDDGDCCVGMISQADIARKSPENVTAEVVKEVSQPRAAWM